MTNMPFAAFPRFQDYTIKKPFKSSRSKGLFVRFFRPMDSPTQKTVSVRTPSGIRTLDPLIKSQLLYQLS